MAIESKYLGILARCDGVSANYLASRVNKAKRRLTMLKKIGMRKGVDATPKSKSIQSLLRSLYYYAIHVQIPADDD